VYHHSNGYIGTTFAAVSAASDAPSLWPVTSRLHPFNNPHIMVGDGTHLLLDEKQGEVPSDPGGSDNLRRPGD
jgi:hypothetical protein